MLASVELYTDEPQRVNELQSRYARIDVELTAALTRWEALASQAAP
jgi:ATP-binding cassette subfamily F protein uup